MLLYNIRNNSNIKQQINWVLLKTFADIKITFTL